MTGTIRGALHITTNVALSLLFSVAAFATPPGKTKADLAVRNVNIVDTRTGQLRTGRTILIQGNRIAGITDGKASVVAERIVDGRGAFAIPGLWDSHVHLLQNDAAAALRTAPVLLSFGITHVRDMGSSTAALRTFRSGEQTTDSPVVIASGPAFWAFALPYGDKTQQRIVDDTASIDAAVRETAAAGADFIKIYAGFKAEKLAALVQAARGHNLRVAGHAQPGAPLDEQARQGLSTVEHLDTATFIGCAVDVDAYFNRIIAARFRNSKETIPAILKAFVEDIDRVACVAMLRRATAAGLAITPTLTASFLPPAIARDLMAGLPEGQRENCDLYLASFKDTDPPAEAEYIAAGTALMTMVRESGMPILAGTDTPAFCSAAGSALTVELHLLGQAGLTPLQVLQSTTLTPARLFGFGDRLGAIEQGMDADFLLLKLNPLRDVSAYANPVGLFTRGRWRDEAQLARLRGERRRH